MSVVIVTGSAGLIGSESVHFFCQLGYAVVGIDNDMRSQFFGEEASTGWNRDMLLRDYANYIHYDTDIRDRNAVENIFREYSSDISLVIHTAAQPSHDWAAKDPFTDFEVNANGTLILLECTRRFCPQAVFIFTSTNKVYGDRPNYLLFGASKVAADVLTQEYGRYFDLKTVCFRGGCLTGPNHAGAEAHGFLSYLLKCTLTDTAYTVFGYKGKQVRDNIHSYDFVNALFHFYENPRVAEVYNIGGGRFSNCSIVEAIALCEDIVGKKLDWKCVEPSRIGDHIWWISDMSKFCDHYPEWCLQHSVRDILEQIVAHNISRWG